MSDFFYLARGGGHFVIEVLTRYRQKEHGPFDSWSAAQRFVILKRQERDALIARTRARRRELARAIRDRRELDQGKATSKEGTEQ